MTKQQQQQQKNKWTITIKQLSLWIISHSVKFYFASNVFNNVHRSMFILCDKN